MTAAVAPRRFLLSQVSCLAVGACLRVALLGVLTGGGGAAQSTSASTLLFFMETGTLCALLLTMRGTPWHWWQTAARGCATLAMVLAAMALAAPWSQRWAIIATAVAGAMCFALVIPAMSRGFYDFVDRQAVARLTRFVVTIDASIHMIGPALVGAVLQHQGARLVFVSMCLVMATAAVAIGSLGGRCRPPAPDGTAAVALQEKPVQWRVPLRILVLVSVAEHLLVVGFFAVFADTVIAAGWSASEIGLSVSLVYAGTLLAMVLPVPSGQRARWLLFFAGAGAIPVLLRVVFLALDPSQHLALLALLALMGVAIGAEQLLFGVLRFDLVPREQAASLQRQLMLGASIAAAAGAGLSALGSAAWDARTTLVLAIAVGTVTMLVAVTWWTRTRMASP